MKGLARVAWLALFTSIVVGSSPMTIVPRASAQEHHEVTAGANHEASGHHAPVLADLLFPTINFAVYLFIVIRFVIPAMREYLRRRHSEMIQAQTDSALALSRAQADLASSKTRLTGLKAEAEGIREDLLAIATRQAERLKVQAEETGARRLADAALLAEQERRRAFASLRAELAADATRLAESRIRTALTSDDQRRFVQQFLKEASAR